MLLDWQVAAFFDEVLAKGSDVKQAANWIMGDIAAHLKWIKLTINEAKLTPTSLAELIGLIKDGTISGKIGKEVCACLCNFHCLKPLVLSLNLDAECCVLLFRYLKIVFDQISVESSLHNEQMFLGNRFCQISLRKEVVQRKLLNQKV